MVTRRSPSGCQAQALDEIRVPDQRAVIRPGRPRSRQMLASILRQLNASSIERLMSRNTAALQLHRALHRVADFRRGLVEPLAWRKRSRRPSARSSALASPGQWLGAQRRLSVSRRRSRPAARPNTTRSSSELAAQAVRAVDGHAGALANGHQALNEWHPGRRRWGAGPGRDSWSGRRPCCSGRSAARGSGPSRRQRRRRCVAVSVMPGRRRSSTSAAQMLQVEDDVVADPLPTPRPSRISTVIERADNVTACQGPWPSAHSAP